MVFRLSTSRWVAVCATALAALLGGTYVLTGLGTARLVRLEQADPLFDFPGAVPEELEAVAIEAAAANTFLAAYYPEAAERPVYPDRLWRLVARVGENRASFLERPNRSRATRLLVAELSAARAYAASARDLRASLDSARQGARSRIAADTQFHFLPGALTDLSMLERAFSLLAANGRALRTEALGRAACLPLPFFCPSSLKFHAGAPPEPTPAPPDGEPLPILPQEYLARTRELLGGRPLSEKRFRVDSDCFGREHPSEFLLWEVRTGAGGALMPKLATNSFFRKIPPDSDRPFEEALRQAGYGYSWQPEANWYLCPDLGYYPELAAMRWLIVAHEERPLGPEIRRVAAGGPLPELEAAETAITAAAVIRPETVERYVSAMRNISADGTLAINEGARGEIRRRIRAWETRSGGFPAVMRGLGRDAAVFMKLALEPSFRLPFFEFFITRNHASLLFAPWNTSVWRINERPRFVHDGDPSTHPSLVSYRSLENELAEADILAIQALGRSGFQNGTSSPRLP